MQIYHKVFFDKPTSYLFCIGLSWIILLVTSILILPEATVFKLCREDCLIENMGACIFLLTSLLFFKVYFTSYTQNIEPVSLFNRNIFFLLLAILFFICAGEEISWGQRVLGWNTPDFFLKHNGQQEINIHNLWLFHYFAKDGGSKSFLFQLINMNRLFSLFWLGYCLLIPALYTHLPRIRNILDKVRLPIPPLLFSVLFINTFFLARLIVFIFQKDHNLLLRSLDELTETSYALYFLLLAIYFQLKYKKDTVFFSINKSSLSSS